MYFNNIFKEVKIREVIIFTIISFLLSLIISRMILKYLQIGLNNTFINIMVLNAQIILCIILFYKLRISSDILKTLAKDFKHKLDIQKILKIIFIYFLIGIGAGCIEIFIVYMFNPKSAINIITESSVVVNNRADYIINLLYIGIFIPIDDELVFRHIFLQRFSKKFNIILALIVTSLLYTSINIYMGILCSFFISIINCIQYIKHKNIFIPIINKMSINIISVLIFSPIVNYYRHTGIIEKSAVFKGAFIGLIAIIFGMFLFIKLIYDNIDFLKTLMEAKDEM